MSQNSDAHACPSCGVLIWNGRTHRCPAIFTPAGDVREPDAPEHDFRMQYTVNEPVWGSTATREFAYLMCGHCLGVKKVQVES